MAQRDPTKRRDEREQASDEAPTCPICDARVESTDESFPFCSKRCRMIDLGRWLGGRYVVSRPISDDDLHNHG